MQGPSGHVYSISGDIMHKLCGWPGYSSIAKIMFGKEITPHCFWMGGKEGIFPNQVWMHLRDFQGENTTLLSYHQDPRRLCQSEPRLHKFIGPENYFTTLVFHPPLTYPDNDDGTYQGDPATALDDDRLFDHKHWRVRVNCPSGRKTCEPATADVTLQEHVFNQTRIETEDPPWPVGSFKWPLNQVAMVNQTNTTGTCSEKTRQAREKRSADISTFLTQFAGQWTHTNSIDGPSAVSACQEDHFIGPDLANSLERKYCKTATRELLPYCETEKDVDCFDIFNEVVRTNPAIVIRGYSENGLLINSIGRERLEIGSGSFDTESSGGIAVSSWGEDEEADAEGTASMDEFEATNLSRSLELTGSSTLATIATSAATALVG